MMVASCPTCYGQVTVPPHAELDARVRCPLCGEEYPLAEAVGDLPPMLIMLDDPRAVPDNRPVIEAAATTGSTAAEPGPEGTAEPAGSEPRGETLKREPLPAVGAVAEDNVRPDTAQSKQVDTPLVFPPEQGGGATSTGTMAKKAHANRHQKSMAGEMIQIVAGGVAAVVLFHAIFWWGLHRDPLRLAPKLPAFMAFLAPADLRGLPSARDPSRGDWDEMPKDRP